MPLHDWTDRPGWFGLHHFWMSQIVLDLQAGLPPGYRAVVGPSPLVAIDAERVYPDVAVTNGAGPHPPPAASVSREPDVEVAVATIDEDATVQVVRRGLLVAAIELISPGNKDRPSTRAQYSTTYTGYLRGGVHLLLVDVHPRPIGFGFAQLITTRLGQPLPDPAAPSAVSYRVGPRAATGGRLLAVWQNRLAVGEPLPSMPLALAGDERVMIDLEGTYTRAARISYVE